MSKLKEIYFDLQETLEDFGLSLQEWDMYDEEQNELFGKNKKFLIESGNDDIAYGEIIVRKHSQATLKKKLEEIRFVASANDIPYCFLEAEDECFICKTTDSVDEIVFTKDYPSFQKMELEYDDAHRKITVASYQRWFRQFIEVNKELLTPKQYEGLIRIQIKKTDLILTRNKAIFTNEKEDEIFKALLGEPEDEYICRYTSSAGLLRILNGQKVGMCCIVGMNDPDEGNYANTLCTSKRLRPYYSTSEQKRHDIELANQVFINSFSTSKSIDKLDMWRWYGEDAKGVCLVYKINLTNDSKFILAPISYAHEDGSHPELDFVDRLASSVIDGAKQYLMRFHVWKHFFKAKEYRNEDEVRLMKIAGNEDKKTTIMATDGIICSLIESPCSFHDNQYPLTLEKIILGPKFAYPDTNILQIKHLLYERHIMQTFLVSPVVKSNIENYR